MIIKFANTEKVNPTQLAIELGLPKYKILSSPHTKTLIIQGGTEKIEYFGYEIEFDTTELTEAQIAEKKALASNHKPQMTEWEEKQKIIEDNQLQKLKEQFLTLLEDEDIKKAIVKIRE